MNSWTLLDTKMKNLKLETEEWPSLGLDGSSTSNDTMIAQDKNDKSKPQIESLDPRLQPHKAELNGGVAARQDPDQLQKPVTQMKSPLLDKAPDYRSGIGQNDDVLVQPKSKSATSMSNSRDLAYDSSCSSAAANHVRSISQSSPTSQKSDSTMNSSSTAHTSASNGNVSRKGKKKQWKPLVLDPPPSLYQTKANTNGSSVNRSASHRNYQSQNSQRDNSSNHSNSGHSSYVRKPFHNHNHNSSSTQSNNKSTAVTESRQNEFPSNCESNVNPFKAAGNASVAEYMDAPATNRHNDFCYAPRGRGGKPYKSGARGQRHASGGSHYSSTSTHTPSCASTANGLVSNGYVIDPNATHLNTNASSTGTNSATGDFSAQAQPVLSDVGAVAYPSGLVVFPVVTSPSPSATATFVPIVTTGTIAAALPPPATVYSVVSPEMVNGMTGIPFVTVTESATIVHQIAQMPAQTVVASAQNPQMPVPMAAGTNMKEHLMRQIEYYFSDDNLARDLFMRRNMDAEGYLPVQMIASFNRIRNMGVGWEDVLQAVRDSDLLELDESTSLTLGGDSIPVVHYRMRTRNDPLKWPIQMTNGVLPPTTATNPNAILNGAPPGQVIFLGSALPVASGQTANTHPSLNSPLSPVTTSGATGSLGVQSTSGTSLSSTLSEVSNTSDREEGDNVSQPDQADQQKVKQTARC